MKPPQGWPKFFAEAVFEAAVFSLAANTGIVMGIMHGLGIPYAELWSLF